MSPKIVFIKKNSSRTQFSSPLTSATEEFYEECWDMTKDPAVSLVHWEALEGSEQETVDDSEKWQQAAGKSLKSILPAL